MKYKLTKVYLTKKGDVHPKTQSGWIRQNVSADRTNRC